MKEKLTKEQENYIIENYHNSQTWEMVNILNVKDKNIIYDFVKKNKLKKDKDFVVIREQNSLTIEQCNFILKNYSNMSNKDIEKELNISHSQLRSFASRRRLNKNKGSKDSCVYTEEQKEYLINNYSMKQNRELSKECNLTEQQISYLAFQLNLKKSRDLKKTKKSILTFEQKNFIKNNYSNMKTNDMCKKLNLSYEQIKSYASNLGLKKNPYYSNSYNGYWKECLEKHNLGYDVYKYLGKETEPKISIEFLYKSKYGKYFINQNYFEKIDNEWKAYWLGFLYADGTNQIKRNSKKNNKMEYTTKLTLSSMDEEHLYKLRDSVQGDSPITQKEVKLNGKTFYSSSFSMCNKKICEDLQRLGCVPKKSLILKFPTEEQVPKEFVRHFIRGYFDGDGCIHINLDKTSIQFNIMGTFDFLKELQKILIEELNIAETKLQRKKENKAYSLQYGSIVSIQKIYNYLYKDCNIYLQRKLEKFNTLLWLD